MFSTKWPVESKKKKESMCQHRLQISDFCFPNNLAVLIHFSFSNGQVNLTLYLSILEHDVLSFL
nr:MAG TPA: hypothetical protein [Caudoviricetes sp.]